MGHRNRTRRYCDYFGKFCPMNEETGELHCNCVVNNVDRCPTCGVSKDYHSKALWHEHHAEHAWGSLKK